MLNIRLITEVKNFSRLLIDLTQAKKVTDLLHVLCHYDIGVIEVSLLFLGLLGQDVAVVSMMTLNLASTGECESLLCTGVSLYLLSS